jgi:L-threonylcarbamoyladenylate synthase
MAAQTLKHGGIMLYPTETVYGIGCDAFNDNAVTRVAEIKHRTLKPGSVPTPVKPLILLIKDIDMLKDLTSEIPPVAKRLMEAFWPGALTLIFNAQQGISGLLTGGTGRLGLRLSSHPLIKSIFDVYDHPLVSTSANRPGEVPSASVADTPKIITDKVDLIIDGGKINTVPSTVIDVTGRDIRYVREGTIKKTEIERVLYDRDKTI